MGSKKKKSSKASGGESEVSKKEEKELPVITDKIVKIEFKLLNWKYMNFTMQFSDSTKIFSIKKILKERHGRVSDLKLCLNSFSESNELNDEMLSLAEVGVKGRQPDMKLVDGDVVIDEDSIPVIAIFYDYKPVDFSDPVLLHFTR